MTPILRAEYLLRDEDQWHYEGCDESANIKDYCECSDQLVRDLLDLLRQVADVK